MSVPLILASSSRSRRMMLESAGVAFSVTVPLIDESVLKSVLLDGGSGPGRLAEELAQAKAHSVSQHHPGALVLGADQVLVCEGQIFNKADTETAARETLNALCGREHQLITAAIIVRDEAPLWRHTEAAVLKMRKFSTAFLDQYLLAEIPEILGSVGCYQIESRGAQLFCEIAGDQFCIRGLPLIPALSALRDFGAITA
ncbi:MAG TPA: Maf family protein [Micropepsaceae bacterium]|nr:Maf family protein [Micropepsaceae bacterium]